MTEHLSGRENQRDRGRDGEGRTNRWTDKQTQVTDRYLRRDRGSDNSRPVLLPNDLVSFTELAEASILRGGIRGSKLVYSVARVGCTGMETVISLFTLRRLTTWEIHLSLLLLSAESVHLLTPLIKEKGKRT